MTDDYDVEPEPQERDLQWVEQQIRTHVDLVQWQPDEHVQEALPICWRRAFQIAQLQKEGVTSAAELARRLDSNEEEIEKDRRLIPYLDRTVAGLLAVLGWHVISQT